MINYRELTGGCRLRKEKIVERSAVYYCYVGRITVQATLPLRIILSFKRYLSSLHNAGSNLVLPLLLLLSGLLLLALRPYLGICTYVTDSDYIRFFLLCKCYLNVFLTWLWGGGFCYFWRCKRDVGAENWVAR
ncbi:hypothetical protein EDC56_1929 [Sinobacterium caligoides]|uniref:Uncharacterized protein n=1 Tax=Sinobacterium caligoides TaxID=933926 RepID=A0A3N2DNW6_9GAMM|nr:hypothetical protein EDC56_1929 [Sinobacterium caligoides]